MARAAAPSWPEDIFDALMAHDVRQVAYVPDAGHADLLERCAAEPGMTMVPLTTEEEGIALLAGAWLGGERGVLLMQSSGVGNCLNMLTLTRTCRFPLLMLITMRGQWGEFNPWQVSMGRITDRALGLAEAIVFSVNAAADLGQTVAAAGRMAFEGSAITAVLIAQRVAGVKTFGQ